MTRENLFKTLVAAARIKSETLDLVERLLALENADGIENVQVGSFTSAPHFSGQTTWHNFDRKYGSISVYAVMPRSFGSVSRFRSFLSKHDLPLHEIHVDRSPSEARIRYMLFAENVAASFAKPYRDEKEDILQYNKLNYPSWYFEGK